MKTKKIKVFNYLGNCFIEQPDPTFIISIQWINVKEKLPEFGEDVLVYRQWDVYKCVDAFYRCKDDEGEGWNWYGFSNQDIYSKDTVKFWLPMPRFPEEKE